MGANHGERIAMERKNAWKTYGDEDLAALERVAAGYIDFISENKTERECAALLFARQKKLAIAA